MRGEPEQEKRGSNHQPTTTGRRDPATATTTNHHCGSDRAAVCRYCHRTPLPLFLPRSTQPLPTDHHPTVPRQIRSSPTSARPREASKGLSATILANPQVVPGRSSDGSVATSRDGRWKRLGLESPPCHPGRATRRKEVMVAFDSEYTCSLYYRDFTANGRSWEIQVSFP
jgi:hypothetical protein